MAEIDKKLQNPDYTSPELSGDFRLKELSIHSPSNDQAQLLDTPSAFVELNIYEDLFSNVLKGTYTFLDTQGLAESIPIIGDETLIISFLTPGGEGTQTDVASSNLSSQTASEETVKQRFKVYDCVEIGLEEKGKIYQLYFVSEEYMFSSKTKVSKGYRTTYSNIVKDVLKKVNNNMRADLAKKYFIEETATPQNVIIPNWEPLQAINFCASRSLSADIEDQEQTDATPNQSPRPLGSLFVFYEKLGTGFFYESIESMIIKQKNLNQIPLFQYAPKLAGDRSTNVGFGYSAVDKYEIKSSFKTLESLNHGLFGSKLIAYDPIRMKYDEIKFDYYKQKENTTEQRNDQTGATEISENPENLTDDSFRRFNDFIATDVSKIDNKQNKIISTNSDFLGSNDAEIKLATTTRSHDAMFNPVRDKSDANTTSTTAKTTTTIGVTTDTFKDLEAKPNNVEEWLLQRQAQIHEFGSVVINFSISGNSARHVGDLIRFEIPTNIPDDDKDLASVPIGHQLYSGLYLISKIRHKITRNTYDHDIELIKNSFAKRIPGQIAEEKTE
ncbi:MAG: hypothetical protein QF460_02960 [Candidatus Nanoarchaeia archaeon]|jgi:hypothetical protein|nr:hypothetical protein [Candidatus Nanoarchaeia archaeon]